MYISLTIRLISVCIINSVYYLSCYHIIPIRSWKTRAFALCVFSQLKKDNKRKFGEKSPDWQATTLGVKF